MQYHLDGFRPGDPAIRPAAENVEDNDGDIDVLIVGCGPAGLTLAAQLAEFGDITTLIVERKDGPLEKGQADGVSCRSMEMFEAFGFAHRVMREAYWVNETVFWTPSPNNRALIARAGRAQDVEDDLSEMPHVILNQARVHDMLLDQMRNAPARLAPDYGTTFEGLEVDETGVTVTLSRDGVQNTTRARYVVGCDGARSGVRRAIGLDLKGDSANQLWGVMDILAVTDFPDIRFKTVIQSDTAGTILIIPREGGHLVRLYVEQDKLAPGERASDRNLRVGDLIAKAQRVFHPYTLDVRDVVWWSAYQIGQRLTDRFDDLPEAADAMQMPRVFIAGDACHTHSPKAGQGMNVSMGDAFNLGWKLASVLRGEADPALLRTYSTERHAVAQGLIDFDKTWSQAIRDHGADAEDDDMPPVQRQFIRQGRYTAGMSVTYAPSIVVGDTSFQDLATGFEVGARFHSAPVLRLADAQRIELGHIVKADGRWRIFLFAPDGDHGEEDGVLARLCDYLMSDEASPVRRYTPEGADIDARIDIRAVLRCTLGEIDITALPSLLLPRKGRFGLRDYEKAFTIVGDRDIYTLRGVSTSEGCAIIVRPDQHIAAVLPLDAATDIGGFFDRFLIPKA